MPSRVFPSEIRSKIEVDRRVLERCEGVVTCMYAKRKGKQTRYEIHTSMLVSDTGNPIQTTGCEMLDIRFIPDDM